MSFITIQWNLIEFSQNSFIEMTNAKQIAVLSCQVGYSVLSLDRPFVYSEVIISAISLLNKYITHKYE